MPATPLNYSRIAGGAFQVKIWNSFAWQLGVHEAAQPMMLCCAKEARAAFSRVDLKPFIVHDLNHRFDFILVTDQYDESLVLLRHKMCWSWSDMIAPGAPLSTPIQDGRSYHKASRTKAEALDPTVRAWLQSLNYLDMQHHQVVLAKFQRAVHAY